MNYEGEPTPHFDDWGPLAAAMAAMSSSVSVEGVANQAPEFSACLANYCPIKAAATFGALTLQRRLQANTLRLETLVHLCFAIGGGERAPTQQLLMQGFMAIGSVCGNLEDVPEDVFSARVHSKRGNYQVVEGLWESGTFYLQRFVNLVDSLPDDSQFQKIVDGIHALLRLSDVVCKRAGLRCNEIGASRPEARLSTKIAAQSSTLRKLVRFSGSEMAELGINPLHLAPFVFNPANRTQLLDQAVTHTNLELKPLVFHDGYIYLLLPTAISTAIRRFFITVLGSGPNRKTFLRALGREYSHLFDRAPFLGGRSTQVPFAYTPYGVLCGMSDEIDTGRYLNVLFVLDDLIGFEDDGFGGIFQVSARLQSEMKNAIAAMQNRASANPGFRDGITLIVVCGVGRGAAIAELVEPQEHWAWKFISAADLITLSRTRAMEPLNLWRIADMEAALTDRRAFLQNINGLLNLFAWAESLDGHLVPHAQVPDEWKGGDHVLHLAITQNALLDLRHAVANAVDEQVQQFVDGTWRYLIKENDSSFEEDNQRPTYVHLDVDGMPRLLGARISPFRCWWYEVEASKHDAQTYENWKTLGVWMARATEVLERCFCKNLGWQPILWRCDFPCAPTTFIENTKGSDKDLDGAFTASIDSSSRTIDIKVGQGFYRALYHKHNIAETALVRTLVEGVAVLAGEGNALAKIEDAIRAIVPNQEVRHRHIFSGGSYRDHFQEELSRSPITISKFDDAALKLGLGWTARSVDAGSIIQGKHECLDFLHTLVSKLQRELEKQLRKFDKTELLKELLRNYDIASLSRDHWHRTARAALAMRDDKDAAMKVMSEHEFKLNGVLQPTRNLVEVAICEAGREDHIKPGKRDIGLILALGAQIFHLGGWADLLHWDLLEPRLKVTAFGDVHANHVFMETVMDGFSHASSAYRYRSSAKKYEKNLEPQSGIEDSSTVDGTKEFLEAWENDFGVPLDAFRRFFDKLEDYGIRHSEPIFIIKRSELVSFSDTPAIGSTILDALTIPIRSRWNELPPDYTFKDIAPWKFRRRLSILRRPLLQLTDAADPEFVVAPGLIRDGFMSTFSNFYEGSYPDIHLGPAMRRYAGFARKRNGQEFNDLVVKRMRELGWSVLSEAMVTKILRKSFDRNYGDVDVLAWSKAKGRILIMECKDLQFRKTYGEVAEQLSDYRGVASVDGKTRDSLRKHLDRVGIIREHSADLLRFLELNEAISIESHLVFSNPVPMMYSNGHIRKFAETRSFDQLAELRID